MKKIILVMLSFLLTVCCLLTSCTAKSNYRLKAYGWQSLYENPVTIDLGTYYGTCNDDGTLEIDDLQTFITEISSRKTPVDTWQRSFCEIPIFFENNAYYTLTSLSYKKPYSFYLRSPSSHISSTRKSADYTIPIFEFSEFASDQTGTLLFNKHPVQVANNWEYWLEFFGRFDESYCKIDQSAKTVQLKALLYIDGDRPTTYLTETYAIELTYIELMDLHFFDWKEINNYPFTL